MDVPFYEAYIKILKKELVPALGCTEPIAIAYAAAKARQTLGYLPRRMEVECSGNIIKNVKGVTVPNSGGLKGIEVAATLGAVGGDADAQLNVLQSVTEEDREKTKRLVSAGFCHCTLKEGVENLYILATVWGEGEDYAKVEIKNKHTFITLIEKNGQVLLTQEEEEELDPPVDMSCLNVKDILDFADHVDIARVKEVLDNQIEMNSAISDEGLRHHYGADVGKTILRNYGADIKTRARARAAAGSDARMSGCAMPVVINSGSGNQGITVSMPVIEYAREYGMPKEKLYRALLVANLVSLHQKRYIGSLSAYCGATSAGCGAACGIAYLMGASYEEICRTIVNTICNIGGMVCDGAKPSCAAKIASAVDAGINAYLMAKEGLSFSDGEGLAEDDIEKTIQNLGRVGKDGMKETDIEILKIMLGQ
ncbi:L-cysteine desulfidase family protein [Zongyangia hominis]|uniref:UPF0597 protein H8709_07740 n=1 Tax=Zongyangia hominis TaxID=2763677 RepID=A0A926EFG4_9FIRM|nr:L-serine ammonia-lyase, iron-sulfur-dependent, subunit alpha [Zongyangia hominis]MBC8570717.1 serine dehydratase subunit alpha family protein [Zongyangia hominis]